MRNIDTQIECNEIDETKFRIEIYEEKLQIEPENFTLLQNCLVDTTMPAPTLHGFEHRPTINYYFHHLGQNRKITQFVEIETWHEIREANLANKFFYLVKNMKNANR